MYAGQCTAECFSSCLNLQSALIENGTEFDFLLTTNESLIPRGRNTSVATFLKTDFTHLMFIDADIEFSPDDVARVWNLQADIGVGLYPMKVVDKPLSAWVDGKLVKPGGTEPFEVDFAGTGFMMIKREVFLKFQEKFPGRAHDEGRVGQCFSWFDPRVIGQDNLMRCAATRYYASEDYAFCLDARKLGFKIIADPNIKLTHWGRYGYTGG